MLRPPEKECGAFEEELGGGVSGVGGQGEDEELRLEHGWQVAGVWGAGCSFQKNSSEHVP